MTAITVAAEGDGDDQTVTDAMLGCWQRQWIRYADGTFDDRAVVIWLQTRSAMADLRVAPDAQARPFAEHTHDQLVALAASESSSGYTLAGAADRDGVVEATWHVGAHGVEYQPVSAFPEPGLLSWDPTGDVMTERAPSGAYVEQWRLLANSRGGSGHIVGVEGGRRTATYWSGDHMMLVRDRAIDVRDVSTVADLVRSSDRDLAAQAVDCEFSYAVRNDDGAFAIVQSTLPWRIGETVAHP
jgi:hypothetical protein